MKKILLGLAFATLTATSVQAVEWKSSCNSDYKSSFGKYTFEVRKGEIGGCKGDKIKQSYPIQSWDWSERSEVKSPRGYLGLGKYVWSSTIDITRNCKPAWRNTIFQIHAGGYLKNPPSWFGINEHNQFRSVHNIMYNNDTTSVPDSPFELRAEIDITKKSVKVDYYVNDKFVVSTKDNQGPYKDLFMKFGIYRVNANCDIKQTYTDVNFKRVNPLKEAFNNLSIDKRKNVQINLKSEGFYSSKIDGYYGNNTEKGLKKYNSSFLDASDLKKSINVEVLLTKLSKVVTRQED